MAEAAALCLGRGRRRRFRGPPGSKKAGSGAAPHGEDEGGLGVVLFFLERRAAAVAVELSGELREAAPLLHAKIVGGVSGMRQDVRDKMEGSRGREGGDVDRNRRKRGVGCCGSGEIFRWPGGVMERGELGEMATEEWGLYRC